MLVRINMLGMSSYEYSEAALILVTLSVCMDIIPVLYH